MSVDRRRFARLAAAPVVLAATPPELWRRGGPAPPVAARPGRPRGPSQELRVDGPRLNRALAELATFGATPAGGTSRVAFSDEDLAAREWVSELMRSAGLDVSVDLAGNLVGRRPGGDGSLPPLLLGSHIDSVPDGGRFDGPVGSMAAVEVAATLVQAGRRTRHPIEVVIWANEEGGKTGSRAWAGEIDPAELEVVTASGHSIAEGTRRIGGDLADLGMARRAPGSLTAYLELHVEQGAVLDAAGLDIGVVEGIVGIRRWFCTVEGFANHAGTTPMDRRRDALVSAARMVEAVHRIARETPGRQVATVGRIEAEPGAPNVVPGRVVFTLEIRDLEMGTVERVFADVRRAAVAIADADGTTVAFEPFYRSRAAPTDPRIRDVIETEAERLGLSTLRMPSGAGHDAQSVALLAPVGMVFVPSRDGVSHSPREFTSPEEVTAGADVLLRTLLALDEGGLEGR